MSVAEDKDQGNSYYGIPHHCVDVKAGQERKLIHSQCGNAGEFYIYHGPPKKTNKRA